MPSNIIDSNRKLCRTWASAPYLCLLYTSHIAAQRKNFVVGRHIEAAGDVLLADGDIEVEMCIRDSSRAAQSLSRWRSVCRSSSRTERPAAIAWPPKRSRMSAQEAMHSCRLKPCTLRPLPLPSPCSSTDTTMTGRPDVYKRQCRRLPEPRPPYEPKSSCRWPTGR